MFVPAVLLVIQTSKLHKQRFRRQAAVRKTVRSTLITGYLAQLEAKSITLQLSNGSQASCLLPDSVRCWKNRQAVQADSFAPHTLLYIHVRHTKNGVEATDVADAASWQWLVFLRKAIQHGTLQKAQNRSLTLLLGTPPLPFTYTLGPSTLWGSKSAQAVSNPFLPGAEVWVIPRALASGKIEARAVADTKQLALLLKERSAPIVHGVVKALDESAHTITLLTAAGDVRILALSKEVEVRQGRRVLSLAAIRAGAHVLVRIHRNTLLQRVVWRISVAAARRR